jgi:hypothetical protein
MAHQNADSWLPRFDVAQTQARRRSAGAERASEWVSRNTGSTRLRYEACIGERIRKLRFLVDPTSAEAQWFSKLRKQVILQP